MKPNLATAKRLWHGGDVSEMIATLYCPHHSSSSIVAFMIVPMGSSAIEGSQKYRWGTAGLALPPLAGMDRDRSLRRAWRLEWRAWGRAGEDPAAEQE
jgi:hypothetical protein